MADETPVPDATPAEPADDFVVASSGAPDPDPVAPDEATATLAMPESPPTGAPDRNADGTFKAKGKPRNDPQARVEQATATAAEAKREREAAQRERDEARADASRLRQELEAAKAPPRREAPSRPPAVPEDPEPNASDTTRYPAGEFDGQFLKDQARWEARQEFRTYQRQQAQAAQQRQQQQYKQQVETSYTERLAKARQTDPTFDTRLKKDAPFNLDLLPHFMTLENAPDLLIYLSEHPDDAQRLASLPMSRALHELGLFSGRLDAAKTRGPAPTAVSKASAPIQPLGGGSSVSADEGSDDESFEAFFKRENDRTRRAR